MKINKPQWEIEFDKEYVLTPKMVEIKKFIRKWLKKAQEEQRVKDDYDNPEGQVPWGK